MEELIFELFAGPLLGITAEMIVPAMPAIEGAAWSVFVFLCAPWFGVLVGYLRDTERHLILIAASLGGVGGCLSYWIYAGSYFVWWPPPRSIASGLLYGSAVGLVPWCIISVLKFLTRRDTYQPGPF